MQKATMITNASYQLAKLTYTTGLLKSLLKTMLRMAPKKTNEKQLEKIYTIDD